MKIEIKKRPRKFKINIGRKKIELSDTAKIYLKKNKMSLKKIGATMQHPL